MKSYSYETRFVFNVLRHLDEVDLPALIAKAEEQAAKYDSTIEGELDSLLHETFNGLLYSGWATDYFQDVCLADFNHIDKDERLQVRHLFIPMVNEAVARIDFRDLAEMILAA